MKHKSPSANVMTLARLTQFSLQAMTLLVLTMTPAFAGTIAIYGTGAANNGSGQQDPNYELVSAPSGVPFPAAAYNEPATLALIGGGLLGLAFIGRRTNRLHQVASRGFVALFTIVTLASFSTVAKADIIVGDDVNTFATFYAGANETTFAVNVANYLTSGHVTKNLLLFESTPGDGSRDYAPDVLSALNSAGYNVTVTSNYASSLSGFDAVFVGEQFPGIAFVDNNALINFANNGGGIYLVGGVGPDPAVEAAGWNTFLNNYGLALATTYNGFTNFPITSANSIFDGVTSLNVGNGQSIIDLFTDPNAEIVQTFEGQNVVAIVHVPSASVPEPGTLSLLFAGGIAVSRLRRLSAGKC